jgi:copper chaperone CopZ
MFRSVFKYLFLLILSLPARAQFLSAKMQIIGLTCSACSFGTERSIRQLKFVEDVKMDLNSNLAEITFKKGEDVSIDKLVQKVYDAGFSVGKVFATYQFTTEKLNGTLWTGGSNSYSFLDKVPAELKGSMEFTFIGEKYMPKKEYKKWKPIIDATKSLPGAIPNGHLYFILAGNVI